MKNILMKRALSVYILLLILLTVICTAIMVPNIEIISGREVIVYGSVSDSTRRVMEESINRIPKKLLDRFYDDQIPLYLSNEIAYSSEDWSAGVTNFKDGKCMNIDIRNVKNGINIRFALTHEFGHYFDSICGNVSESDEWLSITEEEAKNSISYKNLSFDGSHYYAQPREFFAQEFNWYLFNDIDSGKMEAERCPKAHAYIDKLVSQYLN